MLRTFSVALSAIFILGFGFLVVNAAGDGSEPLDTHSERRISRYLRYTICPRTYRNTPKGEAVRTRCEYLLAELREAQETRRGLRLDIRTRSLAERLYSPTKEPIFTEKPPFDPQGAGSEPLAPLPESRVRRYAGNDNCQVNALTDEEQTRCLFLMRERDNIRDLAVERRRYTLRRSRPYVAPRTAKELLREIARRDVIKSAQSDRAGFRRPTQVTFEDFDFSGSGSESLTEAKENRLYRYVEADKCPRNASQEINERCDYLLRYRRFVRAREVEKAQERLRNRGFLGGRIIRRGIDSVYRNLIGNVLSLQDIRRSAGFRGRPKTLEEAESNFQAPVTVPGDCQIDPNLCN